MIMVFGDDVSEKAEFNMAVSYLNRINVLFSSCDQASMNLDIYTWFHSLMATFRELSTWMKEDQINVMNERIKRINPILSRTYQTIARTGKMEVRQDLYMELHDMELELRKVTKESGLLMKMADDAMDSLK